MQVASQIRGVAFLKVVETRAVLWWERDGNLGIWTHANQHSRLDGAEVDAQLGLAKARRLDDGKNLGVIEFLILAGCLRLVDKGMACDSFGVTSRSGSGRRNQHGVETLYGPVALALLALTVQ